MFSDDIENNRSDTVPILDFRVDKAFRLGRYKFTAMFDAVQPDELDAGDELQPHQRHAYNQIIAALDPRTFQVGVRFDF